VLGLEVAIVVVVKRVDVAMAIAKTANTEIVAFVFIVSPY
jgi:hypothetical protein